MREIQYRDAVKEALDEEMERDGRVMVIGEDVAFIGGNFKATVGLYEKYGDLRVKDSPISEAGIVGMGVGMALTGLRPVVELMFSDFLLVAADQVINQMAKIRYMSGGQAKVPMVIRCPIGGGRSSAAQHSQSMQAMVAQFPGIKVLVPSDAQEVKGLLKAAIRDDDPVVFFEHKMEYSNKFMIDDGAPPIPIGKAAVKREGTDITIVATSSLVMKSLAAADTLAGEGISCEVIDLRSIVPLDRDAIIASVRKTGRLLVADEAYEFCGIGAEICASVQDDVFYDLKAPIGRVATPNVPLPFSPALEFPLIPSAAKIADKARAMARRDSVRPSGVAASSGIAGRGREAAAASMAVLPDNNSGADNGACAHPAASGAAGAGAVPGNAGGRDGILGAGVRATSLARSVAAEAGIGLGAVTGSGIGGRIMRADVEAALGAGLGGGQGLGAAAGGAGPAGGAGMPDGAGSPGGTGAGQAGGKRVAQRVPYAGVRKIIGDRLSESKFTAPHLYFMRKADLTELLAMRALVNAKQGQKTSVTDYVARACVMALEAFPGLNASLVGDAIEQYASVNIGIAVAAPGGLIVPVVKEAQALGVVGLSKAAAALVAKARDGKLRPDEYTGGTFTISNLGMFGIENFTAIINPPEAGILAVSATKDEPVALSLPSGGQEIAIRPMMPVTLSVDHRIVDGLLAAQFVGEVKRLLESPVELMIGGQEWA